MVWRLNPIYLPFKNSESYSLSDIVLLLTLPLQKLQWLVVVATDGVTGMLVLESKLGLDWDSVRPDVVLDVVLDVVTDVVTDGNMV